MKNPEISFGRSSPRGKNHWRQRHWKGDVVGGLVLLLILANGVFVFAALHKAPLSVFNGGKQTALFL